MQNDETFFLDPIHFEREQRFSRLIWTAYASHNPLDLGFRPETEQKLHITRQNSVYRSILPAPTRGFMVRGVSGIGKWRII
jgi:hypothetical protein